VQTDLPAYVAPSLLRSRARVRFYWLAWRDVGARNPAPHGLNQHFFGAGPRDRPTAGIYNIRGALSTAGGLASGSRRNHIQRNRLFDQRNAIRNYHRPHIALAKAATNCFRLEPDAWQNLRNEITSTRRLPRSHLLANVCVFPIFWFNRSSG
jgi:hypothetical protein